MTVVLKFDTSASERIDFYAKCLEVTVEELLGSIVTSGLEQFENYYGQRKVA